MRDEKDFLKYLSLELKDVREGLVRELSDAVKYTDDIKLMSALMLIRGKLNDRIFVEIEKRRVELDKKARDLREEFDSALAVAKER